ncbi:MAG: YebC/PmpR family DNA-binding transcriptional regulator [Oleiphilaceae bacterium]|nr:YebC/PmpR family DNA-binding transcriptional regulator [Oleiphilaceae bacterium]
MAGHSKWANIKHRKAAQDARKGKVFTRHIRELVIATRLGGPAPEDNPRLRTAIDKALADNMKKDTIERAIERGAGQAEGDDYEELTYEGYGPGGIAICIEAMTDNRNRTVSEVRHAFNKFGGNLGTDGSVAYLFNRQGVISFGPDTPENRLMEAALEQGAEDVVVQEDASKEVVTTPENYMDVKDGLAQSGFQADYGEVAMVPVTRISLDEEQAETILKLLEWLEELDDVQNVYSNADFPSSVLDKPDS